MADKVEVEAGNSWLTGASVRRVRARQRMRERDLPGAVRGKVVLITGASSGIGEMTARFVATAGGTALLVARSADKLAAIVEDIRAAGGKAHWYAADLSDLDTCDRLAARALAEHGRVDILVNNAGRSIRRSIKESWDRFHDFERTMRLNYFAAVRLILALAPKMLEEGGGQIVNVSSMGVQTSAPEFAAYCASKAALDAFSRAVMTELRAQEPLRITTIQMGLVRTPMISPSKVYKAYPALTPAQAADMVCEAIVKKPLKMSNAIGTITEISYALAPEALKRFYDFAHARFEREMARKLARIEEAEEGA